MGVAPGDPMPASAPIVKNGKVVLVLAGAFLLGGASAEVGLRTHAAVERVRSEREIGAAGQLVALQLVADGEVVARPRLVAPSGKAAELVLHDPLHPESVRLAFRVEATREPTGEISLDYALWIPDRAVRSKGKLSLTPGVEQSISLDGAVVATWLAIPVPSAQFDAFLEAERALRRSGVKAS